jgi:Domain of unknown function (DUF397)
MTAPRNTRNAVWRTSSYSTSGNQCVEVAPLPGGEVAVRDSKNRDGGIHVVSRKTWAAFTAAIKTGQI